MKSYTAICLFCLAIEAMAGCEKNYSGSIVGNWRLVKDSSWVQNAPPFFNAGEGGIRSQESGDYYNFTEDGTVYTQQQGYLDTAKYTFETDHNLTFVYNSWHDALSDSLVKVGLDAPRQKSFHIESLTTHRLILTVNATSNVLTPEGYFLDQYTFTK